MKKVLIASALLFMVALGLLIGLKPYGFDLFGVAQVWDKDGMIVHEKAERFLEALKYKDFDTAAAFHNWEDEQKVDIAELIEDMFKVKPEQLNIRDVKITGVDFDEGHQRARTHFVAITEMLNTTQNKEESNREREIEGVLYWHKRPASEDDAPAQLIEIKGKDGKPIDVPTPVSTALPTTVEGEEDDDRWFLRLESSLHD